MNKRLSLRCLNYHGFPKATCISINEVVCHGIPSDDKVLKNGDIVNIDVTVIKDGYFGDNSKMYIVGGETNIRVKKLSGSCTRSPIRGIAHSKTRYSFK